MRRTPPNWRALTTPHRVALAVFRCSSRNLQRAITCPPRKSSTAAAPAAETTAKWLAVFRCFPLFLSGKCKNLNHQTIP
jgi:hypothetical protein